MPQPKHGLRPSDCNDVYSRGSFSGRLPTAFDRQHHCRMSIRLYRVYWLPVTLWCPCMSCPPSGGINSITAVQKTVRTFDGKHAAPVMTAYRVAQFGSCGSEPPDRAGQAIKINPTTKPRTVITIHVAVLPPIRLATFCQRYNATGQGALLHLCM